MSKQLVDSQGREFPAMKMRKYLGLDGDLEGSGKQESHLQWFGKPFRFSGATLQHC